MPAGLRSPRLLSPSALISLLQQVASAILSAGRANPRRSTDESSKQQKRQGMRKIANKQEEEEATERRDLVVCVYVGGKGSDGRRQSWLEERRRNFHKLFAESIKRGKKHHTPHTHTHREEKKRAGRGQGREERREKDKTPYARMG